MMTQSISKQPANTAVLILTLLALMFPINIECQKHTLAQTNSDQTNSDQTTKLKNSKELASKNATAGAVALKPLEAPLEQQAELVGAIYEATKKTKTLTDYTAFLKQCDQALAMGLNDKNRQYVVSLTGWALNRRAEKRMELSKQLRQIGNSRYESVFHQGMEDFNDATIKAPERVRTWMARGIAHVDNGNYDQGIKDFTQVVKLKPDSVNGWFNRAEALYQRSKIGSGSQPVIAAADSKQGDDKKVDSQNPAATVLAEDVRRVGFEQAVRDYGAVLRFNSNDAEALTGRAHANFALAKFEVALKDYDQVLKLDSAKKSDVALVNRADCLQSLGRWQDAMDDYAAALKIKKSPIGLQRMAWLKATCPEHTIRDAKSASELVAQAISLGGETALNLDTRAAVEAALGNFEVAKTTQAKVIGLASSESAVETGEFKARMAIYEEGKPFVQDDK